MIYVKKRKEIIIGKVESDKNMVQRGKTIRWWNIQEHLKKLPKKRRPLCPWKSFNPYWFRHELKVIRTEIHRKYRHLNRIRIKKGMDYEPEILTNGWLTH